MDERDYKAMNKIEPIDPLTSFILDNNKIIEVKELDLTKFIEYYINDITTCIDMHEEICTIHISDGNIEYNAKFCYNKRGEFFHKSCKLETAFDEFTKVDYKEKEIAKFLQTYFSVYF